MSDNSHKVNLEITEEAVRIEYDGPSPEIVSQIVEKMKDTGFVAMVHDAMKNA